MESGFDSIYIADIKINKQRNLSQELCAELQRKGFVLQKFQKIDMFIMANANNEIHCLGEHFTEARSLEDDEWKEYLPQNYKAKSIIAYHWIRRDNPEKEEEVEEFGELIKISKSTTNLWIIFVYCVVIIILGAIGSWIATKILP